MNLCTIIAKNYVAFARVLARSLVEHDPQARLWTLIIDDFSGYIDPAEEPFEVLTPKDIGCQPFEQMAVRYTVLELSTAVKPWLLRHLLEKTGGPVTYLDPDIRAYGSLKRLDELAAARGVVLIPHNSEPIPFDGRKPSQIDIMIAGVYNLGYISLDARNEVDRLLDWWADRLRRDCRVDPEYGYFVDQRWFDLMPGFLTDVAIVRDPEYNVAYWNLHSRKVEQADGAYLVDGHPLAFFHFSGFDPERPLVLSRYQDRVEVLTEPVLERLLADYATEVMDAGHALTRTWPYGYAALGDGTPLTDELRRLYDGFVEELGEDVPSAFTVEGGKLFVDWLRKPAPKGPPGISRALLQLYEDRPDLQEAYPDLTGADGAKLLHWVEEHGSHEVPLLSQLIAADGSKARSETAAGGAAVESTPDALDAPLRKAPWGVNVVGYFRSELGVAEVARQMVSALDALSVPVLPVHGRTVPRNRQGHSYVTVSPDQALFAVNLICMNADVLPEFAKQADEDFFAGRYSIGLWFWEVSRFPEYWQDSFSLVEEVWAPTAHVAEALAPLATVPVTTVRIPVQPPQTAPLSRAALGLPDDQFVFLFSFDYLSVFRRKNPLAVVEAFRRSFSPGEGAKLILKCINSERDADNHARLCSSVAEHPDIEIVDRYLSPPENNTLTALCDCYVSLHRAEGLGLVMAEAMALGKPVIATGYSGNLDFMTDSNSLLVRHRLVPVGPAAGPYPEEGEWADPDIEHASVLMREVFDDPEAARELGAQAAEDIRRTHSREAAGEILRSRLEEIWSTARTRRPAESEQEAPITLSALVPRMKQPPSPGDQPVRGSPRKLARNVMLRLMRPFTAYQETVNREVLSVLEGLRTGSAPLGLGTLDDQAAHVRLLRELRGYEELKALPSFVDFHGSTIDQIKLDLTALGERVGAPLQLTERTVYLALSQLRTRHAAIRAQRGEPPVTPDLSSFELRVFSQNGEDGVLAEVLRRVGAPTRFFVEFGAEYGREGNCVYLADVARWHGLFLEPTEEAYRMLERKYAMESGVRTIQAAVTPENIEQFFTQGEVPPEPDVLSIDIDGQDYWVWEAIESYRPRVVVIEYNSALDPRRRLVEPKQPGRVWEGTEYFGASLGALRTLGDRKGYRLVHTELSGCNAFFVRDDLGGEAFLEPTEVAVRGAPNYYQSGYRHPPAVPGRRYLDLDTNEQVDGAEAHPPRRS